MWAPLFVVLLCMSSTIVTCQLAQLQPQPVIRNHVSGKPVPLAHLYWHFLIYQNMLDTKADALDVQGKDGSRLRAHMQNRLNFSDAEFASIRTSAKHLTAQLASLDAQAKAIHDAGSSPANAKQLHDLSVQREMYINAEIVSLKQSLPPDKITMFETFITQFFAPKNVTVQVTPSAQPAPSAVHQ